MKQLSQPRVAEMVADILRARIVAGELEDGAFLPKQDDLIAEFGVSRPSIREAMRILETEGLVSVRRGNVGGAQVHAPKFDPAANMLGLVMQAQQVTLADLAAAIQTIEPACAARCARAASKAQVATLVALNDAARDELDDNLAFTKFARRWHDEMVGACGNQTLVLLAGTLQAIWARHEDLVAVRTAADDRVIERSVREKVLDAHLRVTDAIAAKDAEAAHRAAREHLDESHRHVLEQGADTLVTVNAAPVRRR